MKIASIMEGLNILVPHFAAENSDYVTSAEHDQFFVHATDTPLTEDEAKRMVELGWFQTEAADDAYDPEDGWSFFT